MAGSGKKLNALPSSTVRLITSSQVITSAHSVVKELMENALDAAATCIDIKLENYGFGKIEVRDNGCGIERSDTLYMARPHYTSKITCNEDLGSLCGVSEVSITTRTAGDDVSTVYELDSNGIITNAKPSHLGQGTTVVAASLFKNLPVRRQFYNTARKQKDELKRVEDLVVTYGIIYPGVRFELRHNKCVIWQKGAVTDHKGALLGVWGAGMLGHMVHTRKQEEFDIECFLLNPSSPPTVQFARTKNDRCFLFVNKRPVIMKDVVKLLRRYYSNATGCDSSQVPMAFISVTVSPSSVDVNVDPNKTKVMLHEKSLFLKLMADVFAEVYGPLKRGGENNCETESVPPETTHYDVSQRTNNVGDLRKEASGLDGHKPISGEVKAMNQKCEIEQRVKSVSGYHSLIQNDEIYNDSDTLAFSDVMSMLTHSEDFHQHLHPEANMSHAQNLHKEPNFQRADNLCQEKDDKQDVSTSNMHHPSTADSLNSTQSIDFNLLDDDLDIALMENLATETNQNTVLSPGEVKTSRESESCENLFERNGRKYVKVGASGDDIPPRAGDCAAETWSRGNSVVERDGKTVQPVTLLTSSRIDDGRLDKETSLASADAKQMTLHDLVEGHTIKRPSSSYIFFCKEMRSKVAAENSGANFQEIAKLVAEKWKYLSAEERKQYETMATVDVQRFKDEMSSQKQTKMNTPTQAQMCRKKRKLNQASGQRPLPAMFYQMSPATSRVKQERANFSMKALRQTYSKPFQSSQTWREHADKMFLIGQLKSHGVWLGIHDNRIMLFHPTRAKEELICHRLMQNHVLPVSQLEQPITLCAEDLGGQENWTVLQSLEKSAVAINDSYVYYTDARLVHNGLKLRESYIDGNISNAKVVIVAMTTCMNYFGISDLHEILDLITQNSSVTVSECRPSKVRHYIQGEAVRMSRLLPMGLSREDVEDLLEETAQQLPQGTTACFHHRPFLWCLLDLNHMVQSQDLEAMEAPFELTT